MPNYKVLMIKSAVAWDSVSCRKAASSLYPSPKGTDVLLCLRVSIHLSTDMQGSQLPTSAYPLRPRAQVPGKQYKRRQIAPSFLVVSSPYLEFAQAMEKLGLLFEH